MTSCKPVSCSRSTLHHAVSNLSLYLNNKHLTGCSFFISTRVTVSRVSSVGLETRYGLEGPGMESRWGRDFPPIQTGTGAHPASYRMGTGSFSGVKRPGRGVDRPPPSSVEVKERVELYLCSLSLSLSLSPSPWTFAACSKVNFQSITCLRSSCVFAN